MSTETFTRPNQDRQTQADKSLLPARFARGPWVYLHNASGWEIRPIGKDVAGNDVILDAVDVEKATHWEWLPVLQRIEGEPGVGGVTYDVQRRKFNFSGAVTGHAQIKNGIAIEPSDRRLGEFQHYNSSYYDCEGGRKRYVEPGEGFALLRNGVVHNRNDRAAWLRFLRLLSEAEIIEPMQVEVFDAAIGTIEARIVTMSRHASRAPQVAEAKKQIERMRAAWDRIAVAAEAAPVEVKRKVETDEDNEPAAPVSPSSSGPKLPQPKARKVEG